MDTNTNNNIFFIFVFIYFFTLTSSFTDVNKIDHDCPFCKFSSSFMFRGHV